jgi:RNA polymerase-interacting CarD/CdnL/TRCF family regulator
MVLGSEQDVVVLELADGLSVTLRLEQREQVRPLLDEAGLKKVRESLREAAPTSDEAWAKRVKEAQEKLREGDPIGLAEIVRDGARRQQTPAGSGVAKLSVSERTLCDRARALLAEEIGVARGCDRADANAWIDEQLAPAGS